MPLLSLATLLALPAGVGIDEEVEPWEPRARPLLDGPAACVQVQGQATVALAVMQPGGWRGPGKTEHHTLSGPFTGTLDHGVWRELTAALTTAPGVSPAVRMSDLMPVTGRKAGAHKKGEVQLGLTSGDNGESFDISAAGAQGINLVDGILEGIRPDVTLSWMEAGPDNGVVLVQRAPVKGADDDEMIDLRTTFPGRGAPSRLDVTLPRVIKVGDGLVKASIFDGQVHVLATPTPLGPLPTEESASVVAGLLGFTVGVDQRLSYTAYRPCGG